MQKKKKKKKKKNNNNNKRRTSSDHDETFCSISNQFDQRCGRSCRDKVGVSKGHNSIKNDQKQKSKTTCISLYHKQTICKISNQSDERCLRSCGEKISDGGRTDGCTHERTRVISIVPLRLRRVTMTMLLNSSIFIFGTLCI